MRKLCILTFCTIFMTILSTNAQVLKGYLQDFPNGLWGCWRVEATRVKTTNPQIFKEKTVDIWNFFQSNDVIKLSNPFSGATAQIKIENIKDNDVVFSKAGTYENKHLTDTVTINIQGDNFVGENELKLDTISEIDGSIRKTDTATYRINGEKISGKSVKEVGDKQ